MWHISTSNKSVLQQDLISNVKNGYSDKTYWFSFGRRVLIQNTVVDLWEWPTPIYVFPTAWQQMQVISSSINDTLAWTWIQKIHIHYLDSNYIEHTETIPLNWTTPVNTVATDIFRINAMHRYQVWTGWISAWNISLTNSAWTITYWYILAGFNTARQAIYTAPAGKNWYISHWQASSGSSWNHFCQITLKTTSHLWVNLPWVFLIADEVWSQNWGVEVNFPIPIQIPEKSDFKITAISDASNANVTALGAVMGWFETI